MKRGMQFAWIFSLVVGAIILFFAFYFISQQLSLGREEKAAIGTWQVDVLIEPFAWLGSLGASVTKYIQIPGSANFSCSSQFSGINTQFGYNLVSIGIKESKFRKKIYDKYIFSNNLSRKKARMLSKPVEMPWRVGDAFIIIDKEYCFVRAPEWLKKEIGEEGLNIEEIKFESEDCKGVKVCFGEGNCEIKVKEEEGYWRITKEDKTLYAVGDALMLAAVFSPPELYECNLERLFNRLKFQAEIYQEKAKNCCSAIIGPLQAFINLIPSGFDSNSFTSFVSQMNQLKNMNRIYNLW